MARKKKGVKDKYYKLAKEQGYRARSSFKLIQLNRKYGLLDKATRLIDLCAAPGGWLQVAVKCMPRTSDTQIIGVDLLPIKPIRGCVTFQEDITSARCRSIIKNEMKGKKADCVICDGAPNVGAEYSKDAFVQSELVVHALRFATDHLAPGGNFVTKVFRSAEYNALMWAFQQFFRKVEATKPASSRNVSAEIFVVCQGYLAPHKIDPKMLDPKYVLAQVEADENEQAVAVADLFHKKNNQKKNRQGYDESLGQTLFVNTTVSNFVASDEPIIVLAKSNAITFSEDCKLFEQHKATTSEIKEYLSDLKVLGKGELRVLLKWRVEMAKHKRQVLAMLREEQAKNMEEEQEDEQSAEESEEESENEDAEMDEEETRDQELEDEMERLKEQERAQKRRLKKKSAKERAKLQVRRDLGMENEYALDVSELEGPFRLKGLGLTSKEDLDDIAEVNLNRADGSQVPLGNNATLEDDMMIGDGEEVDSEDENDYLESLEAQMDEYYEQFKRKRQESDPKSVQQRRQEIQAEKLAKRKKKTLEKMTEHDMQNVVEEVEKEAYDKGKYLELLEKGTKSTGKKKKGKDKGQDKSDDESSGEDEDEEDDEGMTFVPAARKRELEKKNPLLANYEEDKPKASSEVRASRWFSQGLFDGIDEDQEIQEEESSEDEMSDVPMMPIPSQMTDKAKRHEKRMKLIKRKEKKEAKQAARRAKDAKMFDTDIPNSKFETVPQRKRDLDLVDETPVSARSAKEQEKAEKAKELIRAGFGKQQPDGEEPKRKSKDGFEVVAKEPARDPNDSDSDDDVLEYNSEDYDTDERATHLAVGAMMVRKSRKRAMLDAAYNRYAFNDDTGVLPGWFIEDENKHNRPQLPITKEMVETIKARYKDLASKPTHKVAEARARKKRKMVMKVDAAKRKASAVVDQPDLTNRSKMRAIEKIYKGAQVKRPSALYVVSKRNGSKVSTGKKVGGQQVKVVDKRLKADMKNQKKRDKAGVTKKKSRNRSMSKSKKRR